MRNLATFFVLFALWLLMSGVYSTLVVFLGAASTALAIIFVRRMDAVDKDPIVFSFSPFRFVMYLVWLVAEIFRANVAVARVIFSKNLPTRQHLFAVQVDQESDIGQVIFANSITLTPGTVTVETEPGQFLVHALEFGETTMAELSNMGDRVSTIEMRGQS